MSFTVRPLVPTDSEQVCPMLIDMGFVEDGSALAEHCPDFCTRPDYALPGALEGEPLLGYAGLHDYGPHLHSGNIHRTAKLDDLYTAPQHWRRGVARGLMRAAEACGRARGLRYIFRYANLREATPAYVGMGHSAGEEVQEGFRFFETDFGEGNTRQPHPERGSSVERLGSSSRLGSFPDREEFQVGRTLVWIMIPESGKRIDWLERGDGLFGDLWRGRDRVLAFAQQQSRTVLPDFWTAHDLAGTSAGQLMVWGIWIDPEDGSAVYEVNQNHAFASARTDLPEYPEDVPVMVRRDARGVLSLQNPAA